MDILYKKDSLGAKMSPFINYFCLARVYLRKKDYLCTDKTIENMDINNLITASRNAEASRNRLSTAVRFPSWRTR